MTLVSLLITISLAATHFHYRLLLSIIAFIFHSFSDIIEYCHFFFIIISLLLFFTLFSYYTLASFLHSFIFRHYVIYFHYYADYYHYAFIIIFFRWLLILSSFFAIFFSSSFLRRHFSFLLRRWHYIFAFHIIEYCRHCIFSLRFRIIDISIISPLIDEYISDAFIALLRLEYSHFYISFHYHWWI